jgi:AcrR family transcriptional regulator
MTITDEPRERLVETAGQVFAEKGFQAATVRDISHRAGANIAAINYYFGDKEKLYVEAVKRAFVSPTLEAGMPAWPDGTPARVKLRTFIEHFLAELIGGQRPDWHMQLVARELTQPSTGCLAFVREFARPHLEIVVAILREALPAETCERRLHLYALSIIGQCVYHRCARKIVELMIGEPEFGSYDAACLAEHIADFSLAAIGLASPLNTPRGEA